MTCQDAIATKACASDIGFYRNIEEFIELIPRKSFIYTVKSGSYILLFIIIIITVVNAHKYILY